MCLPSSERRGDKVEMKFVPKDPRPDRGRHWRTRCWRPFAAHLLDGRLIPPVSQSLPRDIFAIKWPEARQLGIGMEFEDVQCTNWLIYCAHLNWPLVRECILRQGSEISPPPTGAAEILHSHWGRQIEDFSRTCFYLKKKIIFLSP